MDAPRVATISYTTHSRHLNYGAVLHGWAFQQVLKRMGCESIAIDYLPRDLARYHFKWPVLGAFRVRFWRHPLLFSRRVAQWLVSSFANIRKLRKFERFFHTRMSVTSRMYSEEELKAADRIEGIDPDVFVCESDVIWKWNPRFGLDSGFLLDFPAADGKRKVAYAPSIRKGGFPLEAEKRFVEYVRGFDAVSSRERAGAEYIERVSGRAVPYLPDPTLLLAAADYAPITAPCRVKGGYVLLYTCMKANVNMMREAKRYAKRTGKRLVEVGNFGINRFLFGHKVVDDAGVEEWLGLVANADAIVCNSFHGICFALIFHKPFFAFKRSDNDWRFTGICKTFNLEDRLLEPGDRIPDNARPIDFEVVDQLVAENRIRAEKFIYDEIARFCDCGRGQTANGQTRTPSRHQGGAK